MKNSKGRFALTFLAIILFCALGIAVELATGTSVVSVVEIDSNESLPTLPPPPEYRIFLNTESQKIHAENCHHVEGSNIVEISKTQYYELIEQGAQVCSLCEEEMKFLH